MKYKNKYLNLLNQKGGTVPPKPKTLPRCYTFYKNLIDKLSTKNEIDILDFYRYCDNSIILNEKNYEWMPKSLKQVGAHEAILPYQFKNKIGFAKIQIK
jgi:hypothetical protein